MSTEKPRTVSNKVVVIAVVAASVLFAIGLWFRMTPTSSSPDPSGAQNASMRIEVLDGLTSGGISGAVVVIPETGKRYQTDDTGTTEPIALPQGEAQALERSWSETSVLIYKDGYVPYALFHVNAAPGQTREGPRVYLFPEASVQNSQPFSVTEGPPREWVNELVEKHKP